MDVAQGGVCQLYSESYGRNLSTWNKVGKFVYSGSAKFYIQTPDRIGKDVMMMYKEYIVREGENVLGQYETIHILDIKPNTDAGELTSYYGLEQSYAVSDALVAGNVEINIGPGATITGDIYGGGKNGRCKGNNS